MTKSRAEIQKKSDIKRGVAAKTYKLPTGVIADIATLAKKHQLTQGELIARAIRAYDTSYEKSLAE